MTSVFHIVSSSIAVALAAFAFGQGSLTPAELELVNSERFRKQFLESYIAESEVEPRATENERKLLQNVIKLVGQEKLDEAAAALGKGRSAASSAVVDFMLANILFQQEKLDEALPIYETSVDKYPRFRRAWRNLAVIHVRKGDFAKAIPAFTRVIELGGGDAVTYGLLGFAYLSVDDSLAAESAYRMAHLLDPGTNDWKMGLARSLFKQSRYADAVALTGRLIADEPNRPELWLLQANAYIGLGQPMKAAENYEIVDGLGGSTPETLATLADIYVNEELFDLAVRRYGDALDADATKSLDRALRASKVLAARGALEQTATLLDRVEVVSGERLTAEQRKDVLKLRARIAVASGASDEEAKVLAEIVALDPLDGEALLLLGQYFQRTGEPEKAVFHYERAASLEKFEADAKVRHAQLLVSQGKYGEALPLLRSAQQLRPRENIQTYLEQIERISRTR